MSDGTAGVRLLLVVLGFWIVMRSVNKDAGGQTLIDHILGQSGGANQTLSSSSSASSSSAKLNAKGQVNPVPGATGSRLDQGFDLTGKSFLAPFTGKVVASVISDPGWQGGGYVAVQNAANPSQVVYFAEGLTPVVQKGQTVRAGQVIGTPAVNPYNAIIGNIETGPANPKNPLQPLAQVVSNPRSVVLAFYNWLRSLGAPAATSTSLAGHA